MPPKRKRAGADTQGAQAPSTRSTTRTGGGTNGTLTVAKGSKTDGIEIAPAQKKSRNTGTKATPRAKPTAIKGRANTTTTKASSKDDDELTSSKLALNDDEVDETTEVAPKDPQETSNPPYTPQRAQDLFDSFADEDDPDVIGPEGMEKLCTEADIPLDGAQPLILAWQLKSSEMGKFTRAEWLNGTGLFEISSLAVLAQMLRDFEDLLIRDGPAITRSTSISSQAKKRGGANTRGLYNRTRYWQYASDRKAAFADLYQFCFVFAKSAQARNIDLETAVALWSVLLAPRYPIINQLTTFLTEKGKYKGANKDIWNMVHEFCRAVDPSLDNYEADGAWPSLLDDFVAWAKSNADDSAKPVPAPVNEE